MGAPEFAVNEPPAVMLNTGVITNSFARNTLMVWVMSPGEVPVLVQEQAS